MERAGEQSTRHRHGVLIASALVLATAAVGTVARGKGTGGPTVLEHTPPTRVTAPSGGPVSFSGTLDRTAVLRGTDGLVRMELVIAASEQPATQPVRVPTDLLVILDRSGSMAGTKLEQARAAVRELVTQLGPEDRFGLVTYSNAATLLIPLTTADGRARDRWFSTVAEITPDGGTNMSSGLDLGLDAIERSRGPGRVPRVILVSDGLANQGDASHEGLVRRGGRAARGEYMLTTVGVGDDFNEYLMTALADAGAGNYYYLHSADDLAAVFAREFGAARATVASGLAVQIEPAGNVRVVDAAGYPFESVPGTEPHAVVFRPGALFAGQERRVWVTLAVPADTVGAVDLGRVSLSYAVGAERTTMGLADLPRVACVQGEDDFYAGVDVSSWTRSVVVDGYNALRQHVAREVKAGRRDEAERAIGLFARDTQGINADVQSAPVAATMLLVDDLKTEVGAAFSGADQLDKQNRFSKLYGAAALDERRAGSK